MLLVWYINLLIMYSCSNYLRANFDQPNYEEMKPEMKTPVNDKIDMAIDYYVVKRRSILNFINNRDDITPDQIIELGAEMSVLESKLTALEVAKEN